MSSPCAASLYRENEGTLRRSVSNWAPASFRLSNTVGKYGYPQEIRFPATYRNGVRKARPAARRKSGYAVTGYAPACLQSCVFEVLSWEAPFSEMESAVSRDSIVEWRSPSTDYNLN